MVFGLFLLALVFVQLLHMFSQSHASGVIAVALYCVHMTYLFTHTDLQDSSGWLQIFNLSFLQVGGGKTCIGPITPEANIIIGTCAKLSGGTFTICSDSLVVYAVGLLQPFISVGLLATVIIIGRVLRTLLPWVSRRCCGARPEADQGAGLSAKASDYLDQTTAVEACFRTLIALFFVTVTGVMQTAFEVFYCIEVSPGLEVIESYPSIQCGTPTYSRLL